MKTAYLLLLTIGWTGLTQGVAHAATSGGLINKAPAMSSRAEEGIRFCLFSTRKSRCFAALSITATLFQGETSQPPPDSGTNPKNGKHPDQRRDSRHVSEKDLAGGPANLIKDNRPRRFPNNRESSTSGNGINLHQRGFDKSGGAAKNGFPQNETIKRVAQTPLSGSAVLNEPVPAPSLVRPTAATPSNVRHRGSNPATVGGLGNRAASKTGSIDGTLMHHRP